MTNTDFIHYAGAFIAAFLAGGINSVAGGGSMISFPILMLIGLPPLFANATNTVGIWPGSIGSLWGFRQEIKAIPRFYFWLVVPAIIGSAIGAFILRHTSPIAFERIVPWLILFATILFIVQAPVRARLEKFTKMQGGRSSLSTTIAIILQLGVAIYGGYFGAGMGILMLSVLGIIGLTDMLEMTAMTSFLSLAINGVAGVIFIYAGLIYWKVALVMAVGSILGGYGAVGVARKIGKNAIRRLVIGVGIVLFFVMLIRVLSV